MIARDIPGLDGTEAVAFWETLLDSPAVVAELSVPSAEMLLANGITPASIPGSSIRQLLLGVVLHTGNELLSQGVLEGTRRAGVATMTFQVVHSGKKTVDAWVDAEWVLTTRALASALDKRMGPVDSALSGKAQSIVILLSQERASLFDTSLRAAIARAGAIAGLRVSFLVESPDSHATNKSALTGSRPEWLFTIGNSAPMDVLSDAFAAVSDPGRQIALDVDAPAAILETLREWFLELAGVTASLHLRPLPPGPAGTPSRVPIPVEPTACLHFGAHIYIFDAKTALWWTRDTAGHGGSVFKTYVRENDRLVHQADRDEQGRPIEGKFKGSIGRVISVATMHSCENYATHVR